MPSPFPGMDPFLENQEWEDFHSRFNTATSDILSSAIRPDYFVRVERRIYLEHVGPDPHTFRRSDVAIVARDAGLATGLRQAVSEIAAPTVCTLPMPEERQETFLVIRQRKDMQVVTVIELLSPANKRSGGDGRIVYLKKRDEVLSSPSHLVEIDLLRGGERLPVIESLPDHDYCCIVSRWYQRPQASLYAWSVQQTLPTIAIPLKRGDDDASLPLQTVLDTVYDRAGYDLSVDYGAELKPTASAETTAWIQKRVRDAAS